MSNETLEELKAIIANAPEDATIVDIENDGFIDYLYCDANAPFGEKIKSCSNSGDSAIEYSNGNIRSLSDIERIIELEERLNNSEPKKEECKHPSSTASYTHVTCDSCHMIRTDGGWGCASRRWFDNVQSAKFYEKNGFLPR